MEERALVEKQNSKKGFEKNEHACCVEGAFEVLDCTARPYLKVAGLTCKIQSLSKVRQFTVPKVTGKTRTRRFC